MKAFMLALWASVVPIKAYVLQPDVSVAVIAESEEETWSDWITSEWYPPAPGSVGILTEGQTKEDADHISDIEGSNTRDKDKMTKKGDTANGSQRNEEIYRLDGEEKVRNEDRKFRENVRDIKAIRKLLSLQNETVIHTIWKKPLLHMEDMTFPLDSTKVTVSPCHQCKEQKRPVTLTMKPQVASGVVMLKNVSTGSQKLRLMGDGPNHKMLRLPKKEKPTSDTLMRKKMKPQKKGKAGDKSKPEKRDKEKKERKRKMRSRFPYFKDEYCPPECACYGRVVQCSDKGVDRIPYGIPYSTRYLLLMNNRIDTIQMDLLGEYLSLEFLVLTNNHLTDGSVEGAFEGMHRLKRLFLDHNWLISVPADLPASLEELHLNGNNVSVMSKASWSCCPALHLLTLANNSLEESVPGGVFSPLVSLRTLTLSHNRLSSTPLQLPKQLRELYLCGNHIKRVPGGVFPPGSELLSLDLSINHLTDAGLQQDSFLHSRMLESLNLEGNLLRSVPRYLPTSLRTLNLEGNAISSVHKRAFHGLLYLEHLSLSRNQITQVAPGAFRGLTALHLLDLSHNGLREVPRYIPPTLHSALFSHNRINSIPRDAFCAGGRTAAPSSLVKVHLEHNLIDMRELDSHVLWCLRGFQVIHFN
ncbi:hypothetical protein GN956_G3106 [Arapaima gigas]